MSTPSIPAEMRRATVCLLLLVVALATAAAAGPYKEGRPIEITGVVTDVDGVPVEDVRVVLEAYRKAFSFKNLSRSTSEARELATTTNSRGEFTLRWPWQDFYNRFELLVGMPDRKSGGREEFRVLGRSELSRTILHGSPVVANVTVTDMGFLEELREFVASAESKDERQVYRQMGRPDRVETFDYPDFEEVSWWYFASGKAYRFRDGELEQVVHFEPVEPFKSD